MLAPARVASLLVSLGVRRSTSSQLVLSLPSQAKTGSFGGRKTDAVRARARRVVGPEPLITALGQSGSFLDGGAPHPLQVAAIPLLDPELVRSERQVLQRAFREKRDFVVARLRDLGFEVRNPPGATFYCWLDLGALPPPLNSGLVFFEEALKEKVIVV